MKRNIAVAGTGYVGLSLAVLLAQKNHIEAVDIIQTKVDMINRKQSPIQDEYIERYLVEEDLDLTATVDGASAYKNAEFVIIAAPTNYDSSSHHFDTSAVETVIETVLKVNSDAWMVIKSTIPVGYTEFVRKKYATNRILFSPEFLRESKALWDNLYPNRIIVGTDLNDSDLTEHARRFTELLRDASMRPDAKILYIGFEEAEAVKLFSNTYLAMRVAYFNELDTYAEENCLDSCSIIEGISYDPRIGDYYNNPSFGYGGYCLPKDSKQLLANYVGIPQELILATVRSNHTRKDYIADQIIKKVNALTSAVTVKKTVGIYRLAMKTGSDNFRQASIFGIIERLKNLGITIIVYEPILTGETQINGCTIVSSFDSFKKMSDVIVANRFDSELEDVKAKVYTRDIFKRD